MTSSRAQNVRWWNRWIGDVQREQRSQPPSSGKVPTPRRSSILPAETLRSPGVDLPLRCTPKGDCPMRFAVLPTLRAITLVASMTTQCIKHLKPMSWMSMIDDAAEGPTYGHRHAQSYDAYDAGFDAYDGFDANDEGNGYDAFEDAMVDALEAEDSDEFLRRIARGVRSAARVAQQVGRGVGQVARVVAPIASMIPLPQAQAIARVANVAGRLLADGADEFEALDGLVDLADAEDLLDAAAPAIATMAVHGVMPQAARLPANTRQQLVRATTQTAQTIARQQGTQAVRALPAVVQTAQRVAPPAGSAAHCPAPRDSASGAASQPQSANDSSPDSLRQSCAASAYLCCLW